MLRVLRAILSLFQRAPVARKAHPISVGERPWVVAQRSRQYTPRAKSRDGAVCCGPVVTLTRTACAKTYRCVRCGSIYIYRRDAACGEWYSDDAY